MKKIILLIFVSFLSFFSLAAQITQAEADSIVIERMSGETKPYTIYVKEDLQTSFEVITSTGEALELDYPCWVYYINFANETNGKYLIVKRSNGNILEINTRNDENPDDLGEWRLVAIEIPFEEYSLVGTSCEWSNFEHDNKIIIINNKEVLEQYVDCSEANYPEVDFSKHTLILASGWIPQGIEEINILFLRNAENKYTLNVLILLNDTAVVSPWHISILVQKINSEATVTLKLITN